MDDQAVVWAAGFGYADREAGVAAAADTVFHVGSVSKAFLGTAYMQLWDQGRVNLEAPLTAYTTTNGFEMIQYSSYRFLAEAAIPTMPVSSITNGLWRVALSGQGYQSGALSDFGSPGLIPVPGDYDGDGKTDPTVYDPGAGVWHILLSGSGYQYCRVAF